MKNINLKSKVATLLSALVIGATAVLPTTPVYASANEVGVAHLYKMENVDSKNGTGDYLLEVDLGVGWKPYAQVDLATSNFAFCDAYDNGYKMGDSTNRYVWKDTQGCIIEDTDNCGYMIMGKLTNPQNGKIQIPLKICAEHREDVVYGDEAGIRIGVAQNGTKGVQVYRILDFKDAEPISARGNNNNNTQVTPPVVQTSKEYVQFKLNEGTYTLGNVGGVKGQDEKKSMQTGEKAYMDNGRTMVPVRYVGEALGCDIQWNPAKREVVVKSGDNTYRLPLNSQYAYDAKGNKYDLSAKTVQKNGRTYVAVGALGRLLNCSVSWDSKTQTATFTKN